MRTLLLLILALIPFPPGHRQPMPRAIDPQDGQAYRLHLPLAARHLPYNETIAIPAGSFWMGCGAGDPDCHRNEAPLHTVYLDAYEIDQYEVSNARYRACVKAGACLPPATQSSGSRPSYFYDPLFDHYPVITVTWGQAAAYCAWQGKRLPTEAEWEKAARGPSDTRIYPWGNQPATCSLANISFCTGDTEPVGSHPQGASPYGVMDMGGNVWEWVADWYDWGYYQTYAPGGWPANPSGPATSVYKALRGGAWDIYENGARVARREGGLPYDLDAATGFRCARTIP